jgi:EAL domain-containing protein (putative c-di-GMP-specific phosphodiesterase class I)
LPHEVPLMPPESRRIHTTKPTLRRKRSQISAVEGAAKNRELYVAFQPIVDFQTGKLFAHEALVRCKTAEFTGPAMILAAALEAGVCGKIGRAIRQLAVDGCANAPLFLNIHPNEFDEGWIVRPDDPMFSHAHPVYLEITEAVPLSHFRHCHGVLRELRSRGVKLAIDDLGAGYSNLKYIADLTPEIVKIDRELIAGVKLGTRLHKLVVSVVRLCTEMGARVVVEGIETHDELAIARDAGAHFAQGFFIARPAFPMPAFDWARLTTNGVRV